MQHHVKSTLVTVRLEPWTLKHALGQVFQQIHSEMNEMIMKAVYHLE